MSPCCPPAIRRWDPRPAPGQPQDSPRCSPLLASHLSPKPIPSTGCCQKEPPKHTSDYVILVLPPLAWFPLLSGYSSSLLRKKQVCSRSGPTGLPALLPHPHLPCVHAAPNCPAFLKPTKLWLVSCAPLGQEHSFWLLLPANSSSRLPPLTSSQPLGPVLMPIP